MKGKKRLIKDAYTAYRKKRYAEAAAVLDNILKSGDRDPYVKTLLAASYLRSGRIDRAASLVEQAVREESGYLPADKISAFLYMKSAPDRESAASAYASIISKHPEDRSLKKAMRRIVTEPDFPSFQKKALLSDFAEPPEPSSVEISDHRRRGGRVVSAGPSLRKKAFLLLTVTVLSFVLFVGSYFFFRNYSELFDGPSKTDFTPVELATISGSEHDIERGAPEKAHREFYADSARLNEDYDRARHLIKKGSPNEALVILNRIMNSNASFSVKERADFLIDFISAMDERTFEKFDLSELSEKPYRYRGVAVNTSGKVANLRRRQNGYTFTLLLDYRERDRFSGTADVFYETGKVDFENGSIVDMDAVFFYASSANRWYMAAVRVDEK